MDNLRNCPICFDIPESEVYQCVRGHTICHICIAKLTSCPQCREPYGVDKIRSRVSEQLLDNQTFDCIYVEGGCKEKLKRQDISKHGETCPKRPIYLCEILGFSNCKYIFDSSDRTSVMKHFKERHSAGCVRSNKLIMRHTDFKSTVEASISKICYPAILDVEDSVFMIVGFVDTNRKSASWMCLQLFGASENRIYEAEFALLNYENKLPLFKWSIPVLKIQGHADTDELKKCPLEIPFSYISKLCADINDISISIVVRAFKPSEKEDSLQNATKMLTVCSEARQLETSLQVVHSAVTCDNCGQNPVIGKRHKCLQCEDYDLCDNCMAAGSHAHHFFVGLTTPEHGQLLRETFPMIRAQSRFETATQAPTSSSGIICDGCQARSFPRKQYKCLQCPDYDLCERCVSNGTHAYHLFVIIATFQQRQQIRQSFSRIRLSDISEISSQMIVSSNGSLCPDIICNGCQAMPILGKQYKCLQCPDYDLCGHCMSLEMHSNHMFIMISSTEQRQLIREHFPRIRL
ncbi:E3 ubiquitin-protein ligase Siah1 [Orchesella cincta]|uniref:RING-type E3 ubiquitin transferase n=1 Tax=Orchesella cincta TaxID=48709 RepID=A0A1D2MIB4_ORCCI|nr:E3 ubiquitin-protein ligase Siah1 [Orchesella cincta]